MESCKLADLKYTISASQDVRIKITALEALSIVGLYAKLWLSIVPARRPSEHTGLGPPQKGVNCNFSWPELDKPYGVRKLSVSDA